MRIIQHLKHKWNVTSWGLIAILISFSLAGSSVVRLKTPILNFILPPHCPTWLRVFTYILLIFPLYQLMLMIYGTVLGQFRFFWDKEKRLWGGLFRLIGLRKKTI